MAAESPDSPDRSFDVRWACWWLLSALPFAAWAIAWGQDFNWDFRNYHYYGAHMLLHGRLGVDWLPGQLQTTLNPTAYVPYYALTTHLPPLWAGAALGLWHGVNFGLVFLLARTLLLPASGRSATTLALACAIVGTSAPTFLGEVGTSFADVVVAMPITLGLCLTVWALRARDRRREAALLALAGCLFGAAVGLKLTAAAFGVGFAVALAAMPGGLGQRLWRLALAGAGALAGVGLTAGYWAWQVWLTFKSPLFPFYNAVFRSPFYPLWNFHDDRYQASSLVEALSYPFLWTQRDALTSETYFRDLRFAAIEVLAFVALSVLALAWLRGRRAAPRPAGLFEPLGWRFVWIYAGVSFAVWMATFTIQRYVVPLEVVTGVVLLGLVQTVWRKPRTAAGLFLGLAVLVVVTTRPARYDHVPYGQAWVAPTASVDLQLPHALYVMLTDHPYAYLVPSFARDATFIRLQGNMPFEPESPLGQRLRQVLHTHRGPIRVLAPERLGPAEAAAAARFGLRLERLAGEIGAFNRILVFEARYRPREAPTARREPAPLPPMRAPRVQPAASP